MNRKNKFFSVSFILVLGLSYLVITNYINNKYANRLPAVPDLKETSIIFQKYITNVNANTLNKASAANLGELGMVYHANNYFEEAETCYQLAIERDSKVWKWSYYLGCLKRELSDSENAIKYFNNVLDIQPNQYLALFYKAEAYNQIGETAKFEKILKSLSGMDKKFFELKNSKRTSYFSLPVYARLELAKLNINIGKLELAENQLKELISNEISFGPAYKQLSVIYAQKGDQKLSKYYSDRSKDLEDYTPPADPLLDTLCYYSRSETYLLKQIEDAIRNSNLDWALELVNLGLRNIPESKYVLSKAVRLYLSMNMARRTVPYLDKHLEGFKEDYKELVDVGKGLSNYGLKNSAQKYFLAAEKNENEKPATKSRLAGIYFERLGMKEKAFELMNDLLKQYPNDPAVIGGATALSIQNGDMLNANKYLSTLKKLDSKNPRINVFKGLIAKNIGDTKGVIKYYELAFKDVPDQAFIINYLSDYYRKNKMWKELADLYETALNFSPNNPNLQEGYGSFLINCPNKKMRNPKQAREFSERALINFRSNVQVQVAAGQSLAMSYFQLNERGKALYYIHKTIQVAKSTRFSMDYIANLEGMLREFQKVVTSN
ncbi:tetratricopeptide repeat protein [Polaribacter sp. L3A8]|uniref:tetratricopeptide repeat protein n=1 Tax=Polaribacter sp. L3A8 TaxID=2686361 RepID=UPI00131E32BD|nr:tetratricopeptide repeat protein [Polaribacter sp. L3A8]